MIKHLTHAQIDKAAWDARCRASANAHWYGLSATLDAAASGWNALIDEETDEQMPLPWRSKLGVKYLYQPFMVQHCGPWSPGVCDVSRFLAAIPRSYRYADIYLGHEHAAAVSHVKFEERRNHVLDLRPGLEVVRAGYSTNHRRSLRKAEKSGVEGPTPASAKEVGTFLEHSSQFREWGTTPEQVATMHRILHSSEKDGSGFGRVVKHAGKPVAMAWFATFQGTLVFLKGMASAEGREVSALHRLIDGTIVECAGKHMQLDLAGGNETDLARFYSGFGGVPVVYLRALMNRLPPIVRKLKQ